MAVFQLKYQNNPNLKEIRKFLRSNSTSAEQILWKYIRNKQLGYKFRRQFSISNFVADFYCHDLKLVIELDGWTHDNTKTGLKDVQKQKFFEEKGYKVFRLTNEEVLGDPEIFLRKINDFIINLSK